MAVMARMNAAWSAAGCPPSVAALLAGRSNAPVARKIGECRVQRNQFIARVIHSVTFDRCDNHSRLR